jgi:dephospho-CoA kinase
LSEAKSVVRLGLTGGIGSGKSTVATLLAKHGASVIDADAISRAATAPNGAAIAAISQAFGSDFITVQGALDRDRMRDLVFSNPQAKARLEGIVHPLVGMEIARQAQVAQEAGSLCTVFDIPLLVESRHWRKSLDRILVVDCTRETQIARVASRNGLNAEEIEKILRGQSPREQRLQAADTVLFNDGIDMAQLGLLVGQIARQFGL